jgi:Zn-dependent peptidase ImmA (M78 family)/transcriptional regulator with XRE-family HTH domain
MTAAAQINPGMLTWARERSGIAFAEFAARCGVTESRLREWESGGVKPTFVKAQQFAKKAHIPFGYLFLNHPPADQLPIPDLRTVGDQGVPQPSAELLDLVKQTMQQQAWYREYLLKELADPCPVVGICAIGDTVDAVVANMRNRLGVGLFPNRGNSDDYYRDLIDRIEALGIMVMRRSYLGSTTRRLRVEEFRGLAIADRYAPVIFVNHADAPGPRLFTLIHELCHIWLGITGVSDTDEQSYRESERFCNAVAAEFLVPEVELGRQWRDTDDWEQLVAVIAEHFRVSKWVIARRVMTLGFISNALYRSYIARQVTEWKQREKSSGGPSYYVVKNSQISVRFSKAVLSQAFNGHLMMREAGQLLDVKPANIRKFAEKVGI